MTMVPRVAAVLLALSAAWAVGAPEPGSRGAQSRPPTDEKAVSQVLERARKAALAKDRKGFLACLTLPSRTLFQKVFPEDAWEPVGLDGRRDFKLLEVRRHDRKPWAAAIIPAKGGDGKDALFLRKESGRWALDPQHNLLEWDTVQAIMRSKKGEKRSKALEAPKLLLRQVNRSVLPEGWSVDDPAAEDDWSHLPGVQEAFNQKLRGPSEKNIRAKFVLFASAEEAEWELWRRRVELGLKEDLAEKQPALGDSSAFGKHSGNSFELLFRKGSTLVILNSNSEDVLPIGEKVVTKL